MAKNDVGSSSGVRPLPVAWYVDPDIFRIEQERVLGNGPHYAGHELLVPEIGDYFTLPGRDHADVLIRHERGIDVVSNVCRHRQALMMQGRGNARSLVCPAHHWRYSLQGELRAAPRFSYKPCLDLRKESLTSWRGLLFSPGRDPSVDLARFVPPPELDFTDYVFSSVVVNEEPYNWKTFMELYVDVYHVATTHPGLRDLVDCQDLQWDLGTRHFLQAPASKLQARSSGSPAFAHWQSLIERAYPQGMPRRGAIWAAYYPHVMVEWYPGGLVVSTLVPRSPCHTTNVVEFYHPRQILSDLPELADAMRACYLELGVQDSALCRRLDDGRRALFMAGREDEGPYLEPEESGIPHFHGFVRTLLEPHLVPRPSRRSQRRNGRHATA